MNEQNNQHNQFVQIRLWDDCINNCSFCSLQNRCRKTSLESKKVRLKKSAELVKTFNAEKIGLIGGEFFEGQLEGCEFEWQELLKVLLDTNSDVLITANLIHEQHFLEETIETCGERLLLCTSYDEVGRFHTETARKNWFSNINKLYAKGVKFFCTCVQTQDLFESKHELPKWLSVNLCDPHLGVDWYVNVDKAHYHEHLIAENTLFNLPKRRDAVRWMKEHPLITERYAAYNKTHSDTIYAFNENDDAVEEFHERLTSENCVNPQCGHPFFCMCYADSSKCMMCDAERIVGVTPSVANNS